VLALRTDVEQLSQAFWETCFENSYLKCHGEAFQELFQTIMERRYPGDFQRVVPWGRAGDLKNDGYLASRRQLFQCYGTKGTGPPRDARQSQRRLRRRRGTLGSPLR